MVKEITNIHINSAYTFDNTATSEYITDGTKIYSIILNTPPIIIKNIANLKVANICHCTTASNTTHTNKIFIFKLEGVQMDYSKYLTNDGGIPTIIATTFDNTRNLYEENDLPLIKQTINCIKLNLSTLNGNTINGFNGYFSITNGGTSYLTGQILTFSGGGGDIKTSIIADAGAIKSLNILTDKSLWSSFTSAPTLQSSVNGSYAILTATISGGVITAITIVNGGIGYRNSQILASVGGGGSGINISISSTSAIGAILGFVITSGGTGFTSTPDIVILDTTRTHDAVIAPLMNYGVITEGIDNTLNFCISLKIEEEINE